MVGGKMRIKLKVGVAVLLAALFALSVALTACGEKPYTPPPPLEAEYEYTITESDATSGKSANGSEFAAANVVKKDSPLEGKVIYWLGSSVTYGAASDGESMADFLAAKTGAVCKKDAVSGTTIFTDGATENTGVKSYTTRLTNSTVYDKEEFVDAFICQISTNDAIDNRLQFRGIVTDEEFQDKDDFDLKTTLGGVEYIIAYVTEIWGCPIYFYSGAYFGDKGTDEHRANANPSGTNYSKLIDDVKVAVKKWQDLGVQIDVIDLYNDKEFNEQVSDEYYDWCTSDPIHPHKAGYLNWWMPYFEHFLVTRREIVG